VFVESFELVRERINPAGVKGSVGINEVGHRQASRSNAQAKASRIASEGNLAAVRLTDSMHLFPIRRRQDVGTGDVLLGGVYGHEIVVGVGLDADHLYGLLLKGVFDPVARVSFFQQ